MTDWHGKPYYSLDAYCKNTYKHKLYKIALNAHLTCPNRDGHLGLRGCIFCSAGGSGEFAASMPSATEFAAIPLENYPTAATPPPTEGFPLEGSSLTNSELSHDYCDDAWDISRQLQEGLALFGDKKIGEEYIAYFQAFTNTYGPLPYLETIYRSALSHPRVRGISIATRPDCVEEPVIELLKKLQEEFPAKFIWIELGLQSIHEKTASYIRRGYPLKTFEDAYARLSTAGFPVIIHLILGLPTESHEEMLQSVKWVSHLHPFGVKLQLLHVLRGTDLEAEYLAGRFETLTKEAYLSLLSECIANLDPEIVIHRVTGDGRGTDLSAPDWSRNKKDVLNSLHHLLKEKNIRQGCHCEEKP